MSDNDPQPEGELLVETLAGFARTLACGYEISDVLHDLSDRVSVLLGVTGAGVSLLHNDRLEFATADNEMITALERAQEQYQQGPCVDACRSGRPVTVADVQQDASRWPDYAVQAANLGIRAVAGVPMRLNGDCIGAVNLYDTNPHSWTDHEMRLAAILCDMATSYLVNASKLDQQRRITEQLQQALDSRVIIEQAKGIIASHRQVSIDEAFRILRRHANDHRASLHATARAVVDLGLRP